MRATLGAVLRFAGDGRGAIVRKAKNIIGTGMVETCLLYTSIAKSVFDALGADTYVINAQPNGLNINNNAGSTHIEGLQKFVVEKGLDIGFAYDGDADRCLCVDEKGNVITGDHILYIYGCYMKEHGERCV